MKKPEDDFDPSPNNLYSVFHGTPAEVAVRGKGEFGKLKFVRKGHE